MVLMADVYFYDLKIGRIAVVENENAICRISIARDHDFRGYRIKETELIKYAAYQLKSYLERELKVFDFPLKLYGTLFQKKIWELLLHIPYGETKSYKEIAEAAGDPKAARAAGRALNSNPVMIAIPCHRVIGSDGSLKGYSGGLRIKRFLIDLEKRDS